MRALILLLLIPSCWCILGVGRKQSVGVTGILTCDGKPAKGVKVKLYEKEKLFDRLLAKGRTDENGLFKLSGTAKEITKIDPQVNVYHKCNYRGICYKKLRIGIPSKAIVKGKKVDKYYDLGKWELSAKLKGVKIDCIN
ncbi:Transthyretin-like family protein [Oesophagostomum dentatum]|uniref:Transthyretin-like family protein n=1 Tax=Oesophagostomum dentatum TaxID=61180 RepID=A0A0B1TU09_OESDE|nr:Transthyretin-like family protein [Oesophagostomum dentatum]